MEFHVRSSASPRRLGILAGSFNPPTLAHMELARAARPYVDEVLCVLPRAFPHKDYFGATLDQRLDMLAHSDLSEPYSIATTGAGLFIDIAQECQAHYGPSTELYFLCGTDAAERILTWDYGTPGVVEQMLSAFQLLVAPRRKPLDASPEHRHRIRTLPVGDDFHNVSSTEVRERVKSGLSWEHLVPPDIVQTVRSIYS